MEPAKKGAIVMGSALFGSAGCTDGAFGCICIPKNSFTESKNALPELADAFDATTRARTITKLETIVRISVIRDDKLWLDIIIWGQGFGQTIKLRSG